MFDEIGLFFFLNSYENIPVKIMKIKKDTHLPGTLTMTTITSRRMIAAGTRIHPLQGGSALIEVSIIDPVAVPFPVTFPRTWTGTRTRT